MENRLPSLSHSAESLTALKAREWLAIAIVVVAVASLTALTQFKSHKILYAPLAEQGSHTRNTTEVIVKGAVHLPGVYQIPREMTLGNLLELAKVNPEANLGKMHLDTVIRKSRLIFVKKREEITVYLSGAVKNGGAIRVLKGTTLEQLIKTTELDEQAYVGALKGKRKLKENELIEIPFRKVL